MKIYILFIVTNIAYTQSISKQVIGSAGMTQTNSNNKVSWTIGEPVVGLMTAGMKQLGNGYYPAMNLQSLSLEDNTLEAQIKVFPNPTSQLLYVSNPAYNSFEIQIVDINGRKLYSGTITKEQPLDVSEYSNGMYLITIINKEANKKNTYKIIKN